MKTRTQIGVDRSIGKAMAYLLNFFVRFAGLILRPDHDLRKPFRVIAVCKFKGMGSIIQATPLIQTLRANYPDARIVFVTTPANVALLKMIPMVNEIIVVDDRNLFRLLGSTVKALFRMWKLRIGVYFDLEIYSHFSSLITTLSVARNRFGFYLRSGNFRMGMYTHMMYFNIKAPVSRVYLQMASLLPLAEQKENLYELTSGVIPDFPGREKEYIVINPNASDLRLERRWPKEKYAELTRHLLENSPYTLVFIGSRSESAYVATVTAGISSERVVDMSGKTSLEELIGLIGGARAMITNDTGPMHLAFSIGCPVVALFGPCSPEQYGTNGKTVCIYKGHYCSPCIHEFILPPCNGNNVCMGDIAVEDVWKALGRLLNHEYDQQSAGEILYRSVSSDFLPGKVTRK